MSGHVNIVTLVDADWVDRSGVSWFVMEHCSGGTLMPTWIDTAAAYYLKLQLRGEHVVRRAHMHERFIIHRDLSLDDVFVDSAANPKIGDSDLPCRSRP